MTAKERKLDQFKRERPSAPPRPVTEEWLVNAT